MGLGKERKGKNVVWKVGLLGLELELELLDKEWLGMENKRFRLLRVLCGILCFES